MIDVQLKAGDFIHLAPVFFTALWACLMLLVTALGAGKSSRLGLVAALGMALGIAVCLYSWGATTAPRTGLFGGMMVTDRFALFLDMLFLIAGLVTVLVSDSYLAEHDVAENEFYALLCLAITGMMLLAHSANFVMFVIGLETMSLAVYALAAGWSGKARSAEAGLKYFVMGAVASAFLLYGIALLYGATGETSLGGIARGAGSFGGSPLFVVAMFMILGAMAFKVALVPFHMWTPDAYEGAPTPVSGFMAAAVKAAGFGALLRVVDSVFGSQAWIYGSTGWINIFWTLSVLTMTVGNISALRQRNVKRMLAYSSIAHAGYLLIGVVAFGALPKQQGPVLFYLLTYALTTVGAFAVVAWIGSRGAERENLEDWDGLSRRHPAMALVMTLFMLSLGGIPPTAGFFAKFYLFKAALGDPQLLTLVIIAVFNSVISIFYYLRPVVAMYFRDDEGSSAPRPLASFSLYAVIGLVAALVLLLGLVPGDALEMAVQATLGR